MPSNAGSHRDGSSELPDLDSTDRRIAELLVMDGMKPATIAKRLGVARSTVTRRLQHMDGRAGVQHSFPELRCPLNAPAARDLFNLCKRHAHPLSAVQAARIVNEVAEDARKLGLGNWLNERRIRKALNRRERNTDTEVYSDSENSVRDSLQMAVARQIVRKNIVIDRLARRIQHGNVRFTLSQRKNATTFSRADSNATKNSTELTVSKPITRYPAAVKLALYVIRALRRENAPNRLKANIDWILATMKQKDDYVEMINAPAEAYRVAMDAASDRFLVSFDFYPDTAAQKRLVERIAIESLVGSRKFPCDR